MVLLPYNKGGQHWTLVVIQPQQRQIVCYDALPSPDTPDGRASLSPVVLDESKSYINDIHSLIVSWLHAVAYEVGHPFDGSGTLARLPSARCRLKLVKSHHERGSHYKHLLSLSLFLSFSLSPSVPPPPPLFPRAPSLP